MNYYMHINGQQIGPLDESALLANGLTPDTMVWTQGMNAWQKASELPSLSYLFAQQQQPPQQQPPVAPPYQQPPAPQPYPQPQQGYQQQGYNTPASQPPMPDNYLVWAILATIFCCLPFGIVSIVKASAVSSAYNRGDYAAAEKNSQDAKKWATWAAITGVIVNVLVSIFYFFVIVAASAGDF